MTATEIKNHDLDQTTCFVGDKNHDLEVSNSQNILSRSDSNSSKMRQEESAQRPHRKRRRLLAGW